MNDVQRSENLMRMFLTGMSYRDHSKTVADNGFFRFMTHCPTVESNIKNCQKMIKKSVKFLEQNARNLRKRIL